MIKDGVNRSHMLPEVTKDMPVYTYRREDGTTFDIQQRFSDDPLTVDPTTGQMVVRVISAPRIIFKGSGFYVTDNKSSTNGGNRGGEKSEAKSESSSDTKSDAKTESKPEAKAEAKSESKSAVKAESKSSAAAD